MAGRRLNSPADCTRRLGEIMALYRSIVHPPELSPQVFAACSNLFLLPEGARDKEQMRDDVAEAISLATNLGAEDDEIYRALFWQALSLVSAREHIVLQPGRIPGAQPLQ